MLYQPIEALTYTTWSMEGAAAGAQRCFEVLDRADDVVDAPDAQAEIDLPFALRKPGAGMLLHAAEEHGLVLSRCWMIGDQLRDVIAGRRAGCRGNLLVRTGRAPLPPAEAREMADGIFDDLSAAVQYILSGHGPASRPAAERRPRPHPR